MTEKPSPKVYTSGRPDGRFTSTEGYVHAFLKGLGPKLAFDAGRATVYKKDFAACQKGFKKGRLLDFGCGMGHFMNYAIGEGWDTVGCDLSKQAVEIARSQYKLDVVHGGIDEVRKRGGQYRLITLWNVLDHLGDPLETLTNLQGLLEEGGGILIRVPDFVVRRKILMIGQALNLRILVKNFGLFHETGFSCKTLAQALSRCGYSAVLVRNSAMAGDTRGMRLHRGLLAFGDAVCFVVSRLSAGKAGIAPSIVAFGRK